MLFVRTNVSPAPSAASAFVTLTDMPSWTYSHGASSSFLPMAFRWPRGAPTRYLWPSLHISARVFSEDTPLSISQSLPILPYFASSFRMNGICVSLSFVLPGSCRASRPGLSSILRWAFSWFGLSNRNHGKRVGRILQQRKLGSTGILC